MTDGERIRALEVRVEYLTECLEANSRKLTEMYDMMLATKTAGRWAWGILLAFGAVVGWIASSPWVPKIFRG